MRVFHFMRKEHAIENVKKCRLKIATLNDMNDPFEFYIRLDSATELEVVRIKNHYNTKVGFLCFTRILGDPVQWAHYADKHRGICMEFEIPDEYLLMVKYLKSPVLVSVRNPKWKHDFANATTSKYEGWKYEQEYRMSINLQSDCISKENGFFFVHFSEKLVPSKVYLGIRCALNREEEEIFKYNGLAIIKMTQDANSYSIVHANE